MIDGISIGRDTPLLLLLLLLAACCCGASVCCGRGGVSGRCMGGRRATTCANSLRKRGYHEMSDSR
jgi:hypothetical protein